MLGGEASLQVMHQRQQQGQFDGRRQSHSECFHQLQVSFILHRLSDALKRASYVIRGRYNKAREMNRPKRVEHHLRIVPPSHSIDSRGQIDHSRPLKSSTEDGAEPDLICCHVRADAFGSKPRAGHDGYRGREFSHVVFDGFIASLPLRASQQMHVCVGRRDGKHCTAQSCGYEQKSANCEQDGFL
ncbi:hypothetical protein HBI56_222790 [Parastagonospora nodorum]|nr:hypothetical protein HBH56_148180 [Parastagonospora nodorum]QRC94091.1 hypothetical protein JI435_430200 [Parastagonospora nodorum SN15]KAH3923204.1 hypothetical protein HBH54_212820 [Parastagonospora nodorum]KAH3946133.1 hypothetical protein HBH53_135640 [Parastagonospora nodorum]KAH3983688.1 hypothetical protein HBH52_064380 [Parastagonospora nodorum]